MKKSGLFTPRNILLLAAVGTAAASGAALAIQWQKAQLGRRVSKDVVAFLKLHGSVVDDHMIQGGPVIVPMKVDDAVVNTVNTILRDLSNHAQKKRTSDQQRQEGFDEVGESGLVNEKSAGNPTIEEPMEEPVREERRVERPAAVIRAASGSPKRGNPAATLYNKSLEDSPASQLGEFVPENAKRGNNTNDRQSGDFSYVPYSPEKPKINS
jgi:hypothetical protein